MAEESDKKSSNIRWWEFYIIRFLLGSMVGALVVLWLLTSGKLSNDVVGITLKDFGLLKFETPYLIVLGVLGITFSYIASAPILVFHVIRGLFFKDLCRDKCNIKFLQKTPWLKWGAAIPAIILVFYAFTRYCTICEGKPALIILSIFLMLFVIQLVFICCAFFNEKVFNYYKRLAEKRVNSNNVGIEYTEYYKHLREHGNAYLIVIMELILGAALYYSPWHRVVIIGIWITPAALIYFFGVFLEGKEFSEGYNKNDK